MEPPKRPFTADRLLFLLLTALVLAVGAWLRFKLNPLPASTADTWGFLKPALLALNGENFEAVYGRPWLYPAFLYLSIKITGGMRAITVLQHTAGMFAGLLLLAAAPLTARRVKSRTAALALTASLLYAALMFLTSNWRVTYEHMLISESLQPLFSSAIMLCAAGTAASFYEKHDRQLRIWGALLIFFGCAGALYQPRFAAGGLLCVALGAAAVWNTAKGLKASLKALLPVFLAAGALWCAGKYFSRHDFIKASTPGDILLAGQAPIIKEELRREASSLSGDRADFLNTLAAQLEIDMRRKPLYSRHGYYPYVVQWHGGARSVAEYFNYDGNAAKRFETGLFLRAAARQPGWYVKKMGRQFSQLYGWTPAMILNPAEAALPENTPPLSFGMGLGLNTAHPLQGGWYQSILHIVNPEFKNSGFAWWRYEWRQVTEILAQPGPLSTYIQDLKTAVEQEDPDAPDAIAGGFPGGIFDRFLYFNIAWYVPLLALFLLAAAALTIRSGWTGDLLLLAALPGFAHLFIFSTTALCAVPFVLEDLRFFQDMDIFFCVAQYCGAAFCALAFLRLKSSAAACKGPEKMLYNLDK